MEIAVLTISDIPQPLNIDMVGRALAASGFTDFHITHEKVTDFQFTIRRTYKDKFAATADLEELRKQLAVELGAIHSPAEAKRLADKELIIPYETSMAHAEFVVSVAASGSTGGPWIIGR